MRTLTQGESQYVHLRCQLHSLHSFSYRYVASSTYILSLPSIYLQLTHPLPQVFPDPILPSTLSQLSPLSPTPLPTPLAPRRPRTSAERTPTVGGAPSLSRPVMQISQQPAGVRPQARLYCLLARGINSGNMCIIQHHGFRAH